jgi:hypothetical protein
MIMVILIIMILVIQSNILSHSLCNINVIYYFYNRIVTQMTMMMTMMMIQRLI